MTYYFVTTSLPRSRAHGLRKISYAQPGAMTLAAATTNNP